MSIMQSSGRDAEGCALFSRQMRTNSVVIVLARSEQMAKTSLAEDNDVTSHRLTAKSSFVQSKKLPPIVRAEERHEQGRWHETN
jgi:hypothetical protein